MTWVHWSEYSLREERQAIEFERDQRRERAERFGAPTTEEVVSELEARKHGDGTAS